MTDAHQFPSSYSQMDQNKEKYRKIGVQLGPRISGTQVLVTKTQVIQVTKTQVNSQSLHQ